MNEIFSNLEYMRMRKLYLCLSDNGGIASVVTLLVLFGITLLTLHTIINTRMNMTSADNYRHRVQSFNAADGVMTLLAQEMIDTAEDFYLENAIFVESIGISVEGAHGYSKLNNIDTVSGAGKLLSGTTDQITFIYQQVSGDADISFRITYLSKTTSEPLPFCGAMIRNSLSSDSRSVAVTRPYISNYPVSMKVRENDGGATLNVSNNPTGYSSWIRLKRTGDAFVSYRSDDGSIWNVVGSDTVGMEQKVYAGVVVGSGSTSNISTAIISNLRGMIRRSYSDSLLFEFSDNTYIKYTVNELGQDLFSMATEAYKLKYNGEKIYVSSLTQQLSRKRNRQFISTAIDSAYVPVTYYDYRADNSNPEFNVRSYGDGMKNMLQTSLDSDRKPVPVTFTDWEQPRSCYLYCFSKSGAADYWYNSFNAATRASWILSQVDDTSCLHYCTVTHLPDYPTVAKGWWFSDSLRTWFRPSDAPDAEFDPLTGLWSNLKNKPSATGVVANEWVGQNYNSGSPYATIVIYDSLKFREIPSGSGIFVFGDSVYSTTVDTQYFIMGCKASNSKKTYKFMPLKNKGFGFDPRSDMYWPPSTTCSSIENFAYTMEIHRFFTYKAGQTFLFSGDDDVWVFINNRLVIDLGGIHGARTCAVDLDTLGLSEGEQYWFDFFYCERFVSEANIYITTNMQMFVPPQSNKRSWKRDYGDLD